MIFVTVGTHEQPFDRLIKKIDDLVEKGVITEKVIVQYGYSTYQAKHCEMHDLFSYQEMEKNIQDARIVISHGGPASFISVLQAGKVPIVVPRMHEYGEHVNDHQVDFVSAAQARMKSFLVVYDVEDLESTILNYDQLVQELGNVEMSNTLKFCENFSALVEKLFG